jgi:hypothetical protein
VHEVDFVDMLIPAESKKMSPLSPISWGKVTAMYCMYRKSVRRLQTGIFLRISLEITTFIKIRLKIN